MENANPIFLGGEEVLGHAVDACSSAVEEQI
jgi:hypothetical protein